MTHENRSPAANGARQQSQNHVQAAANIATATSAQDINAEVQS